MGQDLGWLIAHRFYMEMLRIAGQLLSLIIDRMPVIIGERNRAQWLGEEPMTEDDPFALLSTSRPIS